MQLKEVSSDTVHSIVSAFPEATPDTIVLVSRMLDDIATLRQELSDARVAILDLEERVLIVSAMSRLTGDE